MKKINIYLFLCPFQNLIVHCMLQNRHLLEEKIKVDDRFVLRYKKSKITSISHQCYRFLNDLIALL